MTAEQIHDALTLLPSDLAAEADRYRRRPRIAPSWQRWAAMAACFALVLLAGSFWMSGLSGEKTSAAFTAESAMDQAQAPVAMAPMAPAEVPAEDAPAQAPANGAEPKESGSFSLSSLPRLTLAGQEGSQSFQPRGIQWVQILPDGTSTGFQADVSAPTDHPETLETLILTGSSLEIRWETPPLSVAVACWQLQNGLWLPAELSGEEALTFPAGESVCQVTACWEEGTISYAFRVSRPE